MSRVFVAGGYGFLGSHIFKAFGSEAIREPKKRAYDYTKAEEAQSAILDMRCPVVVNACGVTAGILENLSRPADFFLPNLLSGISLIEKAHGLGVVKFVQIGTVCSYPKIGQLPMHEENFWNGYPEETNAAYGLAKKTLVTMGQLYSSDEFTVISPILANLYGPGDHYEENRSHVIPALIRKFLDAVDKGDKSLTLWGSGKCSREFLYVEDAADAITLLVERYNDPSIINVSSGVEIIIADLAELIAKKTGFKGDIRWDTSKPDGQPRRSFSTDRMAMLGWRAKTSLDQGLDKCIMDCKAWRIKNAIA